MSDVRLYTRRDLVRMATIGIAGTAIAPALEGAGGVSPRGRSIITARGMTICGQKSWSNPYITDGLVAMLDGEWNAGPGLHDSHATVWKDIVGTNDATNRYSASDPIWTDKSFRGDGVLRCLTSDNPILLADEGTIEIVCYDGGKNGWAVNTRGANASGYPNAVYIQRVCYNNVSSVGFGSGYFGNIVVPSTSSFSQRHIITSGRIYIYQYVDGVEVAHKNFNTTNKSIIPACAYSSITYGAGKPWDNYPFSGDVFCVRCYARALTDEEIARNYAVDKVRFNLA